LNPLLISQIKSIRPESSTRQYVDWFSSPSNQICRLAKSTSDSAWEYIWSSDVWSWLNPPSSFCPFVVDKFFRDYGRGTVIVPACSDHWFIRLSRHAHVCFRVHPSSDVCLHGNGDHLSLVLWIFIIDSVTSPPASPPTPITLHVHSDWRSAYRHKQSKFIATEWLAALSRYPHDNFVHDLINGINWGHSLGYKGNRMEPRYCKNTMKAIRFAKELGEKISKEYSAGYRSGPFRQSPPFFNIICNPRSAAIKKHSDSVRLVINMSYPHDNSSVNAQCDSKQQTNLTLDQVAALIKALGVGTLLFKFDVCAAYKQIRLIIDDWHLQGEMFFDKDGNLCFDFCSAANFGARSSGFIWENYGMALEFIFRWVALIDAVVRLC
jgi:hypothetical protein